MLQRTPKLGGRSFDPWVTMTLSLGRRVVAGMTTCFLGVEWTGHQPEDRRSPLPLLPGGRTSRQGIGLDCRALGIAWEAGCRNRGKGP